MATMASAASAAAAAARDIPVALQARRDTLAGVAAARNGPATGTHPLPTPPNSISPVQNGLKAQMQRTRLSSVESDLDLHNDSDSSPPASSSYEAHGDITPTLLAKFHLPEILLNQGPLAIRHITGYLTTSVPGFAGIAPHKARRLVVSALQRGQGQGAEGGGLKGEVEFEKVGWGRWDAKRRGQTARSASARSLSRERRPGPYPTNIPINKNTSWNAGRPRLSVRSASHGNSASFSHDDRDANMLEHEADNMSLDSLDRPGSASCSEAPDAADVDMDDNSEDETDDEDWGAVGAAALRAGSYSTPAEARRGAVFPSYNTGGCRSFPTNTRMLREPRLDNIDMDALAASSDAQEREAIQALLQLRSV
ncbi:hypothetical protein F4808DRAFT_83721 [Astrocystis sublimbata]|nr:hypothetical protein F4808DRAFT_83721 [Astrocystis sublimbata]